MPHGPRIEHGVEHVDDEVEDDEHHGRHQDPALDHGKSRLASESRISFPMPGQLKIASTTTAPASRNPSWRPMRVMRGKSGRLDAVDREHTPGGQSRARAALM
jgi:hypothetical protein